MGAERRARHLRSTSPRATEELAAGLGERVGPGTVIALRGDLGAGKTCFVRGLARGLGIEETVSSPTYTLMQAYEEGRLPLYHFDAWMEGREKALFLDGGDGWLYGEGVSVVEWSERVEEWLPAGRLGVELTHRAELERGLVLTAPAASGALWQLLEGLALPEGMLEEDPPGGLPKKG